MMRPLALVAAFIMPAIVLALMIARFVNVPFLDEWSWTALSVALHHGTLSWSDVFAPHNEHRNVVANLVFVAIDRTIGWNILTEQLVSFALLCIAQIAAWYLVRATTQPSRRLVLFAVCSLLLWSLAQWENEALGYNVGWNACTAAAFVVLATLAGGAAPWRVALAASAIVIATFSSAQGAVLFPIAFVLIALDRPNRARGLAAICLVAALTGAAFLAGYTASPRGPRPSIGAFVAYALTVLGTPIGAWWGISGCIAVGALTLAGFVWLVLRSGAERRVTIVWSCAALYALAGTVAIANSRYTFGMLAALSSRYAAIAFFLDIAVAGLIAAAWGPIARAPRWIVIACGVVIAYGVLDADLHGNRAWQLYAIARRSEVCALARHDDTALRTLANADTATTEREAAALASVNDVPYRDAERACAPATPAR